ncbi:predicted protein [Uncinocarpus reesii 1704]|uniref:Elongin-C n=1 Tax=Uncinocarpus reesii (strain UAMH 1704) TaxID=336963 RepID=C4JQ87_UNCRE|nr:uncharacterized protein UREG_04641 [Uncinocarpus reesii 1704]EEP79795.1 predicted protein [Uncinocarpus reesii 1704]
MATDTNLPEFVTLTSNDGFDYVISRSAACISGTIRRMLDPANNFSEAVSGRCVLENMKFVHHAPYDAPYWAKIRLTLSSKWCCPRESQANVPDMDIPPELCLELLLAADYLDIDLANAFVFSRFTESANSVQDALVFDPKIPLFCLTTSQTVRLGLRNKMRNIRDACSVEWDLASPL